MSAFLRLAWQALVILAGLLSLVDGAFINFQNCLEDSILDSHPLLLQWVPLFFDARFDTSSPYNLNVTLFGNVTGQQTEGTYPPPSDPSWRDPTSKFGKIVSVGGANKYSTLLSDFKVLSYNAYDAQASQFCPHVINESCPLGPLFYTNASDPYDLHAFSIAHDFGSPYMFSTLSATIRVISGEKSGLDLACVSANITPYLGPSITGLITWLPAAILILKGIATIVAAIWSPWGSSDIFRWSSNYGRDEDLLRLVTPGFGDCLQYIQFATLMGSLTLQYPGFFQPAVSKTAWSLLLFNESFVSHGSGMQSLRDGIYVTNGTYGISSMRQLIGMSEVEDVWACMAIFLAVIAVAVIVLCQLGFLGQWLYRVSTKTSEEDLRHKNLPFTLGNMTRLLFNYFILPIVALSLYQFVVAADSPVVVVAMAAVLFVILLVAGGWIMRIIFLTKPRTYLFDDMSTVLLYGPLYNTYSDSSAPFALVPVIITFMRGVAFGAVQPSGTAQIIILAICEIILILTITMFRPFQNQTSMNAYHTFFSAIRLITVILCIAFIPSLGITEAPKGWIGYTILLLHACVLVFAFFLNSAQTLVEVAVRSLGLAGSAAQTGTARGNILGWRALKNRQNRNAAADRNSMSSNAAILRDQQNEDGRTRSLSASSQQLLGQNGSTPNQRRVSGVDGFSTGSPEVGGDGLLGAGLAPGKTSLGAKPEGEAFYRPPRRRTIDALTPGAQSRSVALDVDVPYQDSLNQPGARDSEVGPFRNDSPVPAYIRDRADSNGEGPRTDYAVREVDQYYRGPALSDQPTRKLKTGPADPEGPAASAQSWFQRLAFGLQPKKKKETGKGFEVVRSSRMPPGMKPDDGTEDLEMQESPPMHQEPYQDSPEMRQSELHAAAGAERGVSPLEDESSIRPSKDSSISAIRTPMHPGIRAEYPARDRSLSASRARPSQDRGSGRPDNFQSSDNDRPARISEVPSLAPIETVGGMEVPSRFGSQRSAHLGDATAQSWLHDVDDLDWRNERQQQRPPPISERSNRRPLSREYGETTNPRIPSKSPRRRETTGLEEPTGFMVFDEEEDDPRPSSFANTSWHRAGDSIHRNSFGAGMQASSAEFMGTSRQDQQGGYGTAL